MIEYICETCGKTFMNYKSKPRKYCCKECSYKAKIGIKKAKRIKLICDNCGKEFEVYASDSRFKKTNIKYCSIKCQGEHKRTHDKLIGKKFGRLIILEYIYNSRHKDYFKCKCECGKQKTINANSVISGRVRSCGCLHQEQLKYQKPRTTHGKSNTRIYKIWSKMKNRCYNSNYFQYYLYGGKGIKVCEEWLDKERGFINFYNWAIKNGYKENLTIDRIDGNKNYEPNNCRWATAQEQGRNVSTNVNITYNGETHCIIEWAEILNKKANTLYWRYKHWKNIEDVLNK